MNTTAVLSTASRDTESLIKELGPYHYLHTILEETPNGVVVVGPDHTVIHGNPAACRFLGVPCDKLVGGSFREILGEHNGDLFLLIRDHLNSEAGKSAERYATM